MATPPAAWRLITSLMASTASGAAVTLSSSQYAGMDGLSLYGWGWLLIVCGRRVPVQCAARRGGCQMLCRAADADVGEAVGARAGCELALYGGQPAGDCNRAWRA